MERFTYDAYGKQTITDASGSATRAKSSVGWDRGFTGYVAGNETGLLNARSRMYSPSLGRFVSRDTVGYVDGYQLYMAYFAPNSLDPYGTWSIWGGIDWGLMLDKLREFINNAKPKLKIEAKSQRSNEEYCCNGKLGQYTRDILSVQVDIFKFIEVSGFGERKRCEAVVGGEKCAEPLCVSGQGTGDLTKSISAILKASGVGTIAGAILDVAIGGGLVSAKCSVKFTYCFPGGLQGDIGVGCSFLAGPFSGSFGEVL